MYISLVASVINAAIFTGELQKFDNQTCQLYRTGISHELSDISTSNELSMEQIQ